jgi:hypothetical protein
MSWARIDDQLAFHRKAVSAGNAVVGAWIRMIAWSSAHLSDGIIPQPIARLIASQNELDRAVSCGLLEKNNDDYVIHDYLDWNPSAERIRAERAADRLRKGGRNPAGVPAESDRNPSGIRSLPSHPDPIPSEEDINTPKSAKRQAARRLISEYNRIGSRRARITEANLRSFEARLADTSEADIAGTLEHRFRLWSQGDGAMLAYFTIETLTRPAKFEKYLTEYLSSKDRPAPKTSQIAELMRMDAEANK